MIVNKQPRRFVLVAGNLVFLYHERRQVASWEADWSGVDNAPAMIEHIRTMEIK